MCVVIASRMATVKYHLCHTDCIEDIDDSDTAVCYLCNAAEEQKSNQYDNNDNGNSHIDTSSNDQTVQIDT